MKTPCEEKGYEVGQVFRVTTGFDSGRAEIGDVVVLDKDDGSDNPFYVNLTRNHATYEHIAGYMRGTVRIYPPEPEESKTVIVTCEGKETKVSRKSAKAFNLI